MTHPFDEIAIEAAVNAFYIDANMKHTLTAAWASLVERGFTRDASLFMMGKTWEAFTNYGDGTDVNSFIVHLPHTQKDRRG